MATSKPSAALLRHYDRKLELAHYGIKGMRWGVRKSEPTPVTTTIRPGRQVKAKGGTGQPASDDAIKTAESHRVARKSTTDALSNKELQALVNRMQLEQQFKTLNSSGPRASAGRRFLSTYLQNGGKDTTLANINELSSHGAAKASQYFPGARAAQIGVGIGTAIATAYVNKYSSKKG